MVGELWLGFKPQAGFLVQPSEEAGDIVLCD